MAGGFKQLKRSDVIALPYTTNKNWNFLNGELLTGSLGIRILAGTKLPDIFDDYNDPVTYNQYERLVYDGINQLFYQQYTESISGSIPQFFSGSLTHNQTSPYYYEYNNNPLYVPLFPTASGARIRVINVPKTIFGNRIEPGTFLMFGTASMNNATFEYEIYDDGNGNLFGPSTDAEPVPPLLPDLFTFDVNSALNSVIAFSIFFSSNADSVVDFGDGFPLRASQSNSSDMEFSHSYATPQDFTVNVSFDTTGLTVLDLGPQAGFSNNDNVTFISDLSSFNELTTLTCQNNALLNLPNLPDSLQTLDCANNELSNLPNPLPLSLNFLNCISNVITALPPLPLGLADLFCSSNNLTLLPAFPSSLIIVACSGNSITALPTLNSGLQNLQCAQNDLTAIPTLPSSLLALICNDNSITSLPALPSALEELIFDNNSISTVPTLPTSLTVLECRNNGISTMPTLPPSMSSLSCDENNLSILPTLPNSIQVLTCSGNQFSGSFQTLSTGLINFNCSANQVTSLPTIPSGVNVLIANSNKLTVSAVNNILQNLDTNGLSNGFLRLNAQSPAAPPSGAGITAKNNLITKGWNVLTD